MPCQMCPSVIWPHDAEGESLALAWDISIVLRVSPRAQGWVSGDTWQLEGHNIAKDEAVQLHSTGSHRDGRSTTWKKHEALWFKNKC